MKKHNMVAEKKKKRYMGFTVKSVTKDLNLTYFKFKTLAISGAFDFVEVVERKNGKNSYQFDPLKTAEYIKKYKEVNG